MISNSDNVDMNNILQDLADDCGDSQGRSGQYLSQQAYSAMQFFNQIANRPVEIPNAGLSEAVPIVRSAPDYHQQILFRAFCKLFDIQDLTLRNQFGIMCGLTDIEQE